MRKAELARKKFRPVSVPQRRTLERLSKKAGIEPLHGVRTKAQAGDALDRLKLFLTPRPQLQLDGFSEATVPEGRSELMLSNRQQVSPIKEGAR